MRILKILNKFSLKFSFIMTMVMALITGIFVLIGNPRIVSWSFICWHHIPEFFCVFFLGLWCYETKISFINISLGYIFSALATILILGRIDITGFILITALGFSLFLGYNIKRKGKEDKNY